MPADRAEVDATGKDSRMVVDVKPGEWLEIGGVRVELLKKSGQLARLVVVAPRQTEVKKHVAGAALA